MRVRRVGVENYRGFERLALDLPETGPVVLIGENGAGKSSLLRLIAVALANQVAPARIENEVRLRSDPDHRDPRLECARRALERFVACLPGARYSQPRFSRVRERAGDGRGTFLLDKGDTTLAFSQLSDGEALTLLVVADLARRLALAAPDASDPLAGAGVVLVDEVDQHLHPQWQRAVLPALGATFPNLQLIVTTHSPVILATVPRENIVWLEDFRRVESMPRTDGRDVTSILLEVMRLSAHPPDVHARLAELAEALDRDELERARAVLRQIEATLGPDDPEVVRSQTTLALLEGDG